MDFNEFVIPFLKLQFLIRIFNMETIENQKSKLPPQRSTRIPIMEKKIVAVLEYVLSLYPDVPVGGHAQQVQVFGIMYNFLKGQINYDNASSMMNNLIGNSAPIDKTQGIMSVTSTPIPHPDSDSPSSTILTTSSPISNSISETNEIASSRKKTRVWSTYEDERLLFGIIKFGLDNWTMVSRFVGNGRNRSQCSQRWFRGLDPHLSKNHWTKSEENLLIHLVTSYGERNWTKIAMKMGNRSDIQCRYHYKQLIKERESSALLNSSSSISNITPNNINNITINSEFVGMNNINDNLLFFPGFDNNFDNNQTNCNSMLSGTFFCNSGNTISPGEQGNTNTNSSIFSSFNQSEICGIRNNHDNKFCFDPKLLSPFLKPSSESPPKLFPTINNQNEEKEQCLSSQNDMSNSDSLDDENKEMMGVFDSDNSKKSNHSIIENNFDLLFESENHDQFDKSNENNGVHDILFPTPSFPKISLPQFDGSLFAYF
ncbi:hypothetical protein TRFO_20209 [Tritrichomonas foetus]|uniref:Myb-like DNA-binding domain containing protein n=1 Tax=Tritrichomonas foetus TaxID=1144522 RepID=A0A1J4KL94_9EUKA|nr:hypothetical protein TRFO_20209 [Tritrichomonas foetus]|eukprot:OHT10470.1 hypothetical protein TRFO_20209 [Tritrichomonas foetus]